MESGRKWIKDAVLPDLDGECRHRIKQYYRWPLQTEHEHYAHVFLCELKNEEDLIENWEDIVNRIALYIQSTVESLLERSNFYIWFFVEEEITKSLKKVIEDDTYSAKKFVVSGMNLQPEEKKLELIQKRLFTFMAVSKNSQKQMIEKVVMKNFRAYKGEKIFDFTRKGQAARLVVLYAPNGMGKTSFFDGVEWSLTGSVDRFEMMGKTGISGVVLKNTEAAKMEKASVSLYFNQTEYIKRVVSSLNQRTKRDIGGGKVVTAPQGLQKDLHSAAPWQNMMLQHHKIDGFIAAAKPQELYREWGEFWDPGGINRKIFEQCHEDMRIAGKRRNEAAAKQKALKEEYEKLNNSRRFAESLAANAEKFRSLSGKNTLQIHNFQTISASEYVEWSNRVDLEMENCREEKALHDTRRQYVRNELPQDVNWYRESVIRKKEAEAKLREAEEKLKQCGQKKEWLTKKEEIEKRLENISQDLENYMFLKAQGEAWYQRAARYFKAVSDLDEMKKSQELVKESILPLEREQEQNRIQLELKEQELEEKALYHRLRLHLTELENLQINSEEYRKMIDSLETQQKKMKNELSALDCERKHLGGIVIYSFEDALVKYHGGELEQAEEDEKLEICRKQLAKQCLTYVSLEDQLKMIDQKILEEERVEKEFSLILKESRKLITNQRRTICPVCNSQFADTEELIQSTYRNSSELAEAYKKTRDENSREMQKCKERLERYIGRFCLRLTELTAKTEEKQSEKKNLLKANAEITEILKKRQAQNEEQKIRIQSEDQKQGMYVVYTEAGVESWYTLWKSRQEKEISELKQAAENISARISVYQSRYEQLQVSLGKAAAIIRQEEGVSPDAYAAANRWEELMAKYSFAEIESMIPETLDKKNKLLLEWNACKDELEKYQEIPLPMEESYRKRCQALQEQIVSAYAQCEPAAERIKKVLPGLLLDDRTVEEGAWQERIAVLSQQFDQEERRIGEMTEALSRLKYNHEVENYFKRWQDVSDQIKIVQEEEEEEKKKAEQAEKIYQDAKKKIEQDMQQVLQMLHVSDIYEKLEPHEELNQLVGEFRFNEDDQPELSFRVAGRNQKKFSPEWYFSTAQLNVVAFSIFLGRALQADDPLIKSIFIDDPVGHFDDMNVVEFVDLLRNILENTDRQLIISTHEERVFTLIQRKLPKEEYPVRYIDFRTEWA